jgi:hypothetical protein
MAEAFGLAASILGVAELGISVTQSLYRFTVSYRGADRQVEEIEGRVSVTATILQELHSTVKGNEQYFKRNPTGALEAPVSSCTRDYQRLKDAVEQGENPAERWSRFDVGQENGEDVGTGEAEVGSRRR